MVVVGCDVSAKDAANLPQALARMEAAMARPTKQQAEDWIILLQAACAGGRRSEAGAVVAFELYSAQVALYPADVGREACRKLAIRPTAGSNWFPTLSEVVAECDRLVSQRQSTYLALKAASEQRASA